MDVDNAGGWNDGTHCVTRGFALSLVEAIPTDFETKAVMEGVWSNASTSFAGFATALESSHGIPHVDVGGIFGQGDLTWLDLATADVAFWSHHAYIEYVWSRRQGAPGIDAGAYEGPFAAAEASPADVLGPFNLPALEAIELSCVSYVPDTRMSQAEQTAAPPAPTPAPTPTASAGATATATATAMPTPTATASATPDQTASATPSPTASATPSPTTSATPSLAASATPGHILAALTHDSPTHLCRHGMPLPLVDAPQHINDTKGATAARSACPGARTSQTASSASTASQNSALVTAALESSVPA